MSIKVEEEVQVFEELFQSPFATASSEQLCEHAYALTPASPTCEMKQNKSYGLTLMAVTHGNEVAGIRVLNQVLKLFKEGVIEFPCPIAFVLANPWASKQDVRFIERDLNRSFGCMSNHLHEEKRAKDLEPILRDTSYLVDFHQTIEPSQKPFFIFPYSDNGFGFAQSISQDIPVVTHWAGGFSKDGACSDEFVNNHGGVGITIELGQKGFDWYQEGVGLQVALNAISSVTKLLRQEEVQLKSANAEIYTWSDVIINPGSGAYLDEGWYNFQWVNKGQRLGGVGDRDIVASCSGPILFPKYVRKSSGSSAPKELCRIMKRITHDEIGL